jgi:hypothetical protein
MPPTDEQQCQGLEEKRNEESPAPGKRHRELFFFCQFPNINWRPHAACYTVPMDIEFSGKILFWCGPAPWFFVTVPAKQSREIKAISRIVTYGWGVIPVHVRVGKTEFQTSLFPKDGCYLVPIKVSVRKAEKLEKGDEVTLRLEIRCSRTYKKNEIQENFVKPKP